MASVDACVAQRNLIDLPDDIIIAIASWLRPRHLVTLSQTAQRMCALCSASCLWRPILALCSDDAFLIPEDDIVLYLAVCDYGEFAEKGLSIINQGALNALGRVFRGAHWIDADARLANLCGAKHACACRVKSRWRFGQPSVAVAYGAPSRAEASTWLWMWCSDGDTTNIEIRRGIIADTTGHICGTGTCFSVSLRHGVLAVCGVMGTWHDGVLAERIAEWPMQRTAALSPLAVSPYSEEA